MAEELGPRGLNAPGVFFDLGCGDGRWLKAASLMWRCKCVGLEMDEGRVKMAQENVKDLELVEIRKESVLEPIRDVESAKVIVMYLFRDAMAKMSEVFEGRKGLIIVSVGFGMPGWEAKWTEEEGGIKLYVYVT